MEEELDGLIGRVTPVQIRDIVEYLNEEGHAAWLSESLLPELLRVRGRELAETVDEEWWPEECLPVFAEFAWHTVADKLYVTVLKRLHRTTNEQARAAIRAAVRARCEVTTSDGAARMPRLGARALLEPYLQGSIDGSDEDLADPLLRPKRRWISAMYSPALASGRRARARSGRLWPWVVDCELFLI